MLKPMRFTPFSPGEIKPEGWLRRQLEIQAQGLSGALDKIWPDVRDSRWVGGDRDGWERVPYWLDGFIPLAWLLDDADFQRRARRYIDGILANQQPDGWICPCREEERGHYDVWAAFLICKVLVLYHDCSGDDRIPAALERALHQLYGHISKNSLFNWGLFRWFECLIPIYWLYERTGAGWLLDFASLLEAEGFDYERISRGITENAPKDRRYWTYQNHVVNVAMALKSRALMSRISGEDPDAFARDFQAQLTRFHGMANGHFTGDECLSGTSPIQGSELCGVVEAMYSYEWLTMLTADPFWGDLLERTAYNALPATFTPDMWAHQYVQMTNQMQCTPLEDAVNPFNSNGGEAHLFGLEPNFGCCTANFHQGWPKFALSAVMREDEGFVIAAIAPCSVRCDFGGVGVRLTVDTQYPFRDTYTVVLEAEAACRLRLRLRIPSFCRGARVNGAPAAAGEFYVLDCEVRDRAEVRVALDMEARYVPRGDGMAVAWRGPLLYAVPVREAKTPVAYIRDGVERKFPYCDYHLTPASPWGYAYCGADLRVRFQALTDCPFSPDAPPVVLETKAVPIAWPETAGICAAKPEVDGVDAAAAEDMDLIPYGCTMLRMTELPVFG